MKLQNRTGDANVYLYHFERDLPYAEGMQDYGAFHTGEVPYAYNNLKMSPRPWTAADRRLADQVSDYWVNFARNGDPNCGGAVHLANLHTGPTSSYHLRHRSSEPEPAGCRYFAFPGSFLREGSELINIGIQILIPKLPFPVVLPGE